MTRLDANLQIIDQLSSFLKSHPELRFCQALVAVGIVDTVAAVPHTGNKKDLGFVRPMFSNEFYTESTDTLAKILLRLEQLNHETEVDKK